MGKAASLFEIPPFTLNFYRWTFAWLILAPFTLLYVAIAFDAPNDNFAVFPWFVALISLNIAGVAWLWLDGNVNDSCDKYPAQLSSA